MITTPIATPIINPRVIPRLNDESKLFIWIESSGRLFVLEIVLGSSFGIGSFDSNYVYTCSSWDEIFVNFAASVIGSVVEFPPNNVECVKRV